MTETMLALDIYEEVARDIAAMAVVAGEKTAGERFAGAVRTFGIEAMMRDGRALQSGTSHYMGTNFARAFDITYTSAEGVVEHCETTSWGMSTRMIGGVVMMHGDDTGLILPPRLAPFQVVIIPIGRDAEIADVLVAAGRLADELTAAGVRVRVDSRPQLSVGFKFNEWELRGAPLRLELGPRDLAAGVVTLASRLGGDKERLPLESVAASIPPLLVRFQADLLARATAFRDEHTARADDKGGLAAAVATGFASVLHCGTPECEEQIKEQTTATPRCIPTDAPAEEGTCAWCALPSAYGRRILFGRAY
jgi:prolyl-tRNA synthetase